jgi:hypothetical protein
MARLNEILVGRYNRGLQKLFGIKGPPPVATLAPEIMPSHNLVSGVENFYLEGWAKTVASQNIVAVAAANAGMLLENPLTSKTVAVIERMWFANVTSADRFQASFGAGFTDLTVLAPINFDPRGVARPVCKFSSGTAVSTFGFSNWFMVALANTVVDFVPPPLEIPLLPGFGVQVTSIALNVNCVGGFIWRERALEESEQT